ncbi:hypothetical protein PIB30_020567 [Stylosanthes scabra]|uniref:Disease resistance RPP13-like protein 1 n=1 Tax=Stylosanthes scabra TaxID=79078 RepID=A0ABU6Q8I2_9FABA|nr:hypothetical protein [Stylosanthes scabra]
MAAKLYGGAYLSSFVDAVLNKLSSLDVNSTPTAKKLADQNLFQRLMASLRKTRPVLDDAEQKQMIDQEVKKWLVDLQDALYMADDLLDELSTKAAIAPATPTQRDQGTYSSYCHTIVNSILEDSDDDDEMGVVDSMRDIVDKLESIVKEKDDLEGIGGVGKTTLAQWIYNDARVKERFATKAWVCVATKFDPVNVTKAIVEDITSSPSCQKTSCPCNMHSSLSTNFTQYTTPEQIGRKIVEKCKGLPLAVKTLGGLLHNKYNEGDWENILESEIWELSEDDSKIIPTLRVSYHHLPSHLKRCFVYCSLYPKDFQFDKDDLILLWMAEDLLQPMGNNTLENIGSVYFDELVARSFFQPSSASAGLFVMHDLMHDLARFFARKFFFKEFGNQLMVDSKTRHFSCNRNPISSFPEANIGAIHMRTFIWVDDKSDYIEINYWLKRLELE